MITDDRPFAELAPRLFAAAEVSPLVAVQYRRRKTSTREALRELSELTARLAPERIFVNDRLDLALSLGASFHAPASGYLPGAARPLLGPGRWISCAVHDLREAGDARGADLALVSPVFPTPSKPGATCLGVEGYRALAAELPCDAVALGGITEQNASGLGRAAVIRAVLDADDAAEATAQLLDQLPPTVLRARGARPD